LHTKTLPKCDANVDADTNTWMSTIGLPFLQKVNIKMTSLLLDFVAVFFPSILTCFPLRPSLKKCLFAVTRPTHKICPYSKFIWEYSSIKIKKKSTYLPTLKILGQVTANKHFFKDGLMVP
jgi:hypothetical protein